MLDWSQFYDQVIGEVPIIIYGGEFDERDGPTSQVDWMQNLMKLDHD